MWFESVYDDDYDRVFENADFERRLRRERQFEHLDFEHYNFTNKQIMNRRTYVNVLLFVCKNGYVNIVLDINSV